MVSAAKQVVVGMADIHVGDSGAFFTCLGLGSCIGVAALDPQAGVSGMVHIMLPEAFAGKAVDKPGKFADTAIPELLRLLEEKGAVRRRLVIAYCGGASVFNSPTAANKIDVGARNAAAVQRLVGSHGLSVRATDVGGSNGRTMFFSAETGEIKVRTVRQGEVTLCNLRG